MIYLEYTKQNFYTGQKLLASHLNHIEDGIANIRIDASLTNADQAADAKTVGDTINKLTTKIDKNTENVNKNTKSVTSLNQAVSQLKEDLSNKLPKSPTNWDPWTAEEQTVARERMGIPGAYALVNEITLAEAVGGVTLSKTASGENYNFSDVIILVEVPNQDNPTCYISLNGIIWAGGMIRNSIKYHYLRIGVDGGRNRFEYSFSNDSSSLVAVNTLLLAMAWYPINKITEIKIVRLSSTNIPEGVTFKVYAR